MCSSACLRLDDQPTPHSASSCSSPHGKQDPETGVLSLPTSPNVFPPRWDSSSASPYSCFSRCPGTIAKALSQGGLLKAEQPRVGAEQAPEGLNGERSCSGYCFESTYTSRNTSETGGALKLHSLPPAAAMAWAVRIKFTDLKQDSGFSFPLQLATPQRSAAAPERRPGFWTRLTENARPLKTALQEALLYGEKLLWPWTDR